MQKLTVIAPSANSVAKSSGNTTQAKNDVITATPKFRDSGSTLIQSFFKEKEISVNEEISHWCTNCGSSKVKSDDPSTGKFLFLNGMTYVKDNKVFVERDSQVLIAICKDCIEVTCKAGFEV